MTKGRLLTIVPLSVLGLLRGVLVVWTAVTLVFVAVRVLPGDAVSAELLPAGASAAQVEAEKEKLGLNRPPTSTISQLYHGYAARRLGSIPALSGWCDHYHPRPDWPDLRA
ncbi:MAG: hypothetical protein F9K46_14525 [Anaerolineae bacterium]|nr:MAG: hypothetical protein F9K46_14525 [Anaerolineae bacterium]